MLRKTISIGLAAMVALAAYAWWQARTPGASPALTGVALADTATSAPPAVGGPPPGGPPGGRGAGGPGGFMPMATDSFAAQRDSMANAVLAKIHGREQAPAESVFRNIKLMKGRPAESLVRAMNLGFGRSLGVGCLFCHVRDKFDSDDKKEKLIARDMMEMANAINTDLVPMMTSLKGERVQINCGTCHQGHKKPMFGGPPRGGPPGGGPGGH